MKSIQHLLCIKVKDEYRLLSVLDNELYAFTSKYNLLNEQINLKKNSRYEVIRYNDNEITRVYVFNLFIYFAKCNYRIVVNQMGNVLYTDNQSLLVIDNTNIDDLEVKNNLVRVLFNINSIRDPEITDIEYELKSDYLMFYKDNYTVFLNNIRGDIIYKM